MTDEIEKKLKAWESWLKHEGGGIVNPGGMLDQRIVFNLISAVRELRKANNLARNAKTHYEMYSTLLEAESKVKSIFMGADE